MTVQAASKLVLRAAQGRWEPWLGRHIKQGETFAADDDDQVAWYARYPGLVDVLEGELPPSPDADPPLFGEPAPEPPPKVIPPKYARMPLAELQRLHLELQERSRHLREAVDLKGRALAKAKAALVDGDNKAERRFAEASLEHQLAVARLEAFDAE